MEVSISKDPSGARRSSNAPRAWRLVAACVIALPLAACAVGDGGAKGASAGASAGSAVIKVHSTLKPNPEFAHYPQYTGTLGKRAIVMRLGKKTDPDDPSGIHGEYQFTDTGEVILIAGDRTGQTLEAEESDDGTRIVGNWVGTFAADGSISGDRMEVDDSNPQPFELKPLAAGTAAPLAASPAAKGGQAVNGVGNVVTGE
ncbi:hypothetical protein [Paraburkholderia tropica]|uniref:hypothetical protein n=1 Tax=Paraburkholderia tropica TaxID=92647 RepID=UPI0009F2D867|nr:hypothetical protein [Paraburkholderia tropica]MBB2983161.1 hypothetical protein [Paraburkholderia tropica]